MDFPLDQGEVRTPTAAGSARVAWPKRGNAADVPPSPPGSGKR